MIIGVVSADYMRADRSHDGQEHWGGSGWARLGQYLPYLRAAGHEVVTGVLWQEDDTCLVVEDADLTRHFPDIILSQRLMHGGLDKAYEVGRQAGQIVVNDIDDWYWGLSPDNEAFLHSHPKYNLKENTTFYKRSLMRSSHITVSTPYLQQRISDWYKGPITLLPNYVDVSRFTPVTITDTTVPDVGWAGSTSHRSGDVETLAGILPPMARAGKIKLVHAGDFVNSPSYASKLGCEEELVARKIARTGAEDYPSILQFEVGVVPLRDTSFNEAKSYIKGLEYAAAGIPFVAPKFGEYNHLHQMWSRGDRASFFVAKNPQQWVKHIEALRNPIVRRECQKALLSLVKQHDIAIGAQRFVEYIESLVVR